MRQSRTLRTCIGEPPDGSPWTIVQVWEFEEDCAPDCTWRVCLRGGPTIGRYPTYGEALRSLLRLQREAGML